MKRIKQWGLFLTLELIGIIAFCVLCCEDAPGYHMSDSLFFGSKLIAIVIIGGCILLGRYLYRKGMLPYFNNLKNL